MAASYPHADSYIQNSIDTMYKATADDRGTVQALARELDDAQVDGTYFHCLAGADRLTENQVVYPFRYRLAQ